MIASLSKVTMSTAARQQRINTDFGCDRGDRVRLALQFAVAPQPQSRSFLWFAAAALVAGIWFVLNS
jgi:hypothetical protein